MTAILKPAITVASALWILLANTALEAPRMGFVRLANEEVWSLRGIGGSFYYGQRAATKIDHHAFNGLIGVRTSGDEADLLGASGEVLRVTRIQGAVLAIGLSTIEATAYVLTDSELWRLDSVHADRFEVPNLPEGRLAGISGAGPYVDFAIASEGQVGVHRIWLDTGETLLREVFKANPEHVLFLSRDMLLWSEEESLYLRRSNGTVGRMEIGARTFVLHEVGPDWIHATADDGRQLALQLTGDPRLPQSMDMRLLHLPDTAK